MVPDDVLDTTIGEIASPTGSLMCQLLHWVMSRSDDGRNESLIYQVAGI